MTTHIVSAVVSVTVEDVPVDVDYDVDVETFDEAVERAVLMVLEKRLIILDHKGARSSAGGLVREISCEHADWNAV